MAEEPKRGREEEWAGGNRRHYDRNPKEPANNNNNIEPKKKYAKKTLSVSCCACSHFDGESNLLLHIHDFVDVVRVYTDDYTTYSRGISDSRCDNRSVYRTHEGTSQKHTWRQWEAHTRLCFLSVSEPNHVCILWISCSAKLVLLSTKWKIIREGNRSCDIPWCVETSAEPRKSKTAKRKFVRRKFLFRMQFLFCFSLLSLRNGNFQLYLNSSFILSDERMKIKYIIWRDSSNPPSRFVRKILPFQRYRNQSTIFCSCFACILVPHSK